MKTQYSVFKMAKKTTHLCSFAVVLLWLLACLIIIVIRTEIQCGYIL